METKNKSESILSEIERPKTKRIFKIIVIGDSNVGKTCLTFRFCEGRFPTRTEATIGVDFREKALNIGSQEIKLQLWDTAGQERFRQSMLPHYYRNVHAVVFVYDVTKPSSFNSLPGWLRECDQHYLPAEVPRLLIGNKCDEPARVSTQAAQRFADQHCMPVFETSAKDDSRSDHVDSIFLTLAHKLVTSRPLMTRSLTAPSSASASSAAAAADLSGGSLSLHQGSERRRGHRSVSASAANNNSGGGGGGFRRDGGGGSASSDDEDFCMC